MTIQPNETAPYAPASTVVAIIKRYRDRGLSVPFTADVLARAGVSKTVIPRTIQALRLLDLIDDDGNPTAQLEALGRTPSGEYKTVLAGIVRSAYAEVFKFADPATDTPHHVHDAFRGFNPRGQQLRMVTLFLALCEEAGIEVGASRVRQVAQRPVVQRKATAASSREFKKPMPATVASGQSLPPALAGLLQQLPTSWSRDQRNAFVKTFEAVLDFCVPIVETPANNNLALGEGEEESA